MFGRTRIWKDIKHTKFTQRRATVNNHDRPHSKGTLHIEEENKARKTTMLHFQMSRGNSQIIKKSYLCNYPSRPEWT